MSGIEARVRKHLRSIEDSPVFDLDVEFRAGSGICLLTGPSGSGKTLLLNCLGGFARPDEGRILVDNEIYFDGGAGVHLAPNERKCGYIFQDHALFPHMSVGENVRFALSAAAPGMSRRNSRRRIGDLLASFELNELADRKPAQLSGGQKQRAALARTLAREPRLLLLDEPSRGLDHRLRQNFYDMLRSLRERTPVPIVLVSHDPEECFGLADTICLLEAGRILQQGPREAVLQKPASVAAARLLNLYSVTPATVVALDPGVRTSRLQAFGQELEGPYLPGHLIGDSGFLCLRHSEIAPANGVHPENGLLLTVERCEPAPNGLRVFLEGGISVVMRDRRGGNIRPGERIELAVPESAIAFLAK